MSMMKMYNTNTIKNDVLTNNSETHYVSINVKTIFSKTVKFRIVSIEYYLYEQW